MAKKEFKTPEYLKRQEYSDTKTFKTKRANESGDEAAGIMDRLFKADSSPTSNEVAVDTETTAEIVELDAAS